MNSLTMDSYAKINLSLDVISKREDGYHNINTIMQSIDLKDELKFERLTEDKCIIESNSSRMPKDENNLIYRVWDTMKNTYKLEGGLKVYVDKNIPIGAGLAGGSSNAASTIKAVDSLWNLQLDGSDQKSIGKNIGADISFCLEGGTKIATGIGEVLEEVTPYENQYILLCNPGFEISTKEVYEGLILDEERLDMDRLLESLNRQDIEMINRLKGNKMEELVVEKYPEINKIKEIMNQTGSILSLMSGSGPSVFGLYTNQKDLNRGRKKLENLYSRVYTCKTI